MCRISSIEFINHPIFKTAIFDFRNGKKIANTIVFAGENGSGKTRLLEELYYGTKSEYSVNAPIRTECQTIIRLELTDENFYNFENPKEKILYARLIASSDSDSNEVFRKVEFFKAGKNKVRDDIPVEKVGEKEKHNQVTKFMLNSAYSTTEINYLAKRPVTGVTSEVLDSGILKETDDVAREVTQLLVDIASQDNDEIALYVHKYPTKPVPKTIRSNLRIKRFTRAYKTMFGTKLKYKTTHRNIIPIFEKDGQEIDLNSLSSGEKQIVFRSTYLLRNINNLVGAPIFLDEPELSMHPKWARKIYEFYRNLFVTKNKQNSQVFMATHSADIIGAAIEDKDAVVLSLCLDCNSAHKYSKNIHDEILPTTTIAELKYFIFGIPSVDFHIQLYSYLQNTYTNGRAIRTIDDFLISHGAPRKKTIYKAKSNKLVYHTLPTFIRNNIDHPDTAGDYTEKELEQSIVFMIGLIRKLRKKEKTA